MILIIILFILCVHVICVPNVLGLLFFVNLHVVSFICLIVLWVLGQVSNISFRTSFLFHVIFVHSIQCNLYNNNNNNNNNKTFSPLKC